LVLSSQANPEISPEVDGVLGKAMAQNREQRFVSATEMRRALHGTDQATTVINRGEAQTVLFPPAAKTVASATQVIERQPTIKGGETTVVRVEQGSKRPLLPWLLSTAAIVLLACGAFAYYSFRQRSVSVVQLAPTTPTPVASPVVGKSPAAPVENPNTVTKVDENQEPRTTSKKTEQKNPRTDSAKKATTVPSSPTPPEDEETAHEVDVQIPGLPKGPIIIGKKSPGRPQVIQVGPNIIRNFPDGSQMVQLPDGTRIFRSKDGKERILRPGEKPNRRRPPSPE
jgi:hypothetical protein